MKRKWWIVGILGFLEMLVCVAILATMWNWTGGGWGGSGAHAAHRSRSNFVDKTDVVIHTLVVRPAMETVDMRMRVELGGGTLAWMVKDPNGVVRWEGEASGAEPWDESRHFSPVTGEWVLEMSMEDASGHYDVYWTASD